MLEKDSFKQEYLDRLLDGRSFIVTSPGINPNTPFLICAKKRKIKIIGELELGAKEVLGDIIAVTGTNGKTTTVSLINFLLKDHQQIVFLGGNIGVPVTSFCSKTNKRGIK